MSAKVQDSGYGTYLMNHLKNYQTQQNILDLLTYADTTAIGHFKNKDLVSKNFTTPNKIVLNFYKDALLMHCRLNAKILHFQL